MTANIRVAERKCYINGRFVDGRKQFPKINPVDGTVVAQVHEADRAMVDEAVRAAKAALKGPWGKMALQARVDLLRKVAEGIDKRFDDFVAAEVADTGKPVSLASHLDIPRGAANFRVLCRHRAHLRHRILLARYAGRQGRGQLRDAQAPGRGRRDRALEPAAAAAHLEARPRARLRQHGRGQAVRGNALDRDAARRGHARSRSPAGRVQRRARLRPRFGGRIHHDSP